MSHPNTLRYADWSPTTYDAKGLGLPDRQDWIVAPCLQTRDSDSLERANYESQTAILDDYGAVYETHSFGHWGPGWVEITLVAPQYADAVESIHNRLSDYPVLDECRWSELESEAREQDWSTWGRREFQDQLQQALGFGDSLVDWLDDSDQLELIDSLGSDCETEYTEQDGFNWIFPARSELASKVRQWRKAGAL